MVDYALLAKALGVGRKKVGLASVVDCVRVFGYVPGTMPPLGHRSIVETLIDPACVADDSVPVCLGSGSQDFNLLLKPAELLSLSGGRAVKLQKREASAASASSRQVSSPANPGELRFLLTPELSRLVRWLRAVGVDARLSEESSPDFDVILDKAEEEGGSANTLAYPPCPPLSLPAASLLFGLLCSFHQCLRASLVC